jgi:Catalase-related immune-responsive
LWDNQPEYAEPPLTLEGDTSYYDHRLEDDHWEQPGNLFRKMTLEQRQLLFDNTARAINGASQEVLERHVANRKSRSCLWRWAGTSIEAECLKGRLTTRIRPPTEQFFLENAEFDVLHSLRISHFAAYCVTHY